MKYGKSKNSNSSKGSGKGIMKKVKELMSKKPSNYGGLKNDTLIRPQSD